MTERVHTSMEGRTVNSGDVGALTAAHEELEAALAGLDTQVYLTPEEQFERKRIQKRKLLLKDRIRSLMRERN